jgi:hypothetical protein
MEDAERRINIMKDSRIFGKIFREDAAVFMPG